MTDAESKPKPDYIVGIGASAGGLEAIEQFFHSAKEDERIAYIVVQHLSPNFKSLMGELLSPYTDMAVLQAEDGMLIESNTVYLIPPKVNLTIGNGRIHLSPHKMTKGVNLPIDIFFRSLAIEMQNKAIGVILSGTGSDGSEGIRLIKDYDGFVLAQDLESADFVGMPQSALETGMVDLVVPPSDMPLKIQDYLRTEGSLKDMSEADLTILREENALTLIFSLLQRKYNIDFGEYKLATMLRRIERRIHFSESGNISNYLNLLRQDAEEADQLFRDLLVEVTHFFRDQEAFKILSTNIIPQLVSEAEADNHLRIWVPGCATGEEAYSLAILFHEYLTLHQIELQVKIFATDVHQQSLDFGSRGIYSQDKLASVPANYLERYFIGEGSVYTVSREIRKMVIFAQHNLIQDPPFTRLNLIACRNVLIYFRPTIQKRVLENFLFALKKNGVLFLGPSENTGDLSEDFTALNHRWRLYKKEYDRQYGAKPVSKDAKQIESSWNDPTVEAQAISQYSFSPKTLGWEKELLNRFVPSGFLVDQNYDAIHIFGDAGKYLAPTSGRVTFSIFNMIQGHLHSSIRAALHRANQSLTPVTYQNVRLSKDENDDTEIIKLSVDPIKVGRSADLFFLISISPGEQQESPADDAGESYNLSPEELDHIKVLEQELQFAKEHLQLTIEELETTNEELQSTNEELIASNEELQSTNEELHSVNEELYTVNSEYQLKINELTKLNNDIKNLHRSSKVRILFLDRHLRIRDFTPEMASTFNLLPQDVGRPVEHLLYNINIGKEELSAYAKSVLDKGESMVKEIETGASELFLMHVLPYQLETGTIEGIVLYMTDISKLKIMEEEMRKNQKRFTSLLNHIRRPIIYHDSDGKIIHVNAVMAGLVERDFSELIGENLKSLIVNGTDLDRYLEAANQDQPTPRITLHMQKTDGSKVDVTLDSRPIFDVVGNLIEYQGIGSVSA